MSWRIGELLIQKKLITWEQLEEALEEQKKTGELTGEVLLRLGYISERLFYQTLAEQHQMRFVDLDTVKINPDAVDFIPKSVAEKFSVMAIDVQANQLLVAISNIKLGWPKDELKKLTGFEIIKPFLTLPYVLSEAIKQHYQKA